MDQSQAASALIHVLQTKLFIYSIKLQCATTLVWKYVEDGHYGQSLANVRGGGIFASTLLS